MALLPKETTTPIAKDTTPATGRTVRYRVLERAFVNGSLHDPGAEILAPAGLEGPALERIDAPGATKHG